VVPALSEYSFIRLISLPIFFQKLILRAEIKSIIFYLFISIDYLDYANEIAPFILF
jgi:hypothetical protein